MDKHIREIKLAFGSILLAMVVLGFYVIQNSQGVTPISLPFRDQLSKGLRLLLPQGWGFFTKSPRDEDFFIYHQTNVGGEWQERFIGPFSDPKNIFGIGRYVRIIGVEYGALYEKTPEKLWRECKQTLDQCLARNKIFHDIYNATKDPNICGRTYIVMQRQTPWAWAREQKEYKMPYRYIGLNVICNA